MTHLLDTDTCIGVLRQRPGMVQRLSQIAPTDCAVSMVTVYELFCGVEIQGSREGAPKARAIHCCNHRTTTGPHCGGRSSAHSRRLGAVGPNDRTLRFANRRSGPREWAYACDR